MSIALFRIDDRLIHGQVVVGWGKPLNVRFIVLVDDAVRANESEQELYRMGVPPEIELAFASTAEALAELPAWERDPRVGQIGVDVEVAVARLVGAAAGGRDAGADQRDHQLARQRPRHRLGRRRPQAV